ncbi:MAG: zinc-binding dehydrogenase [Candidatus Marinimicrobia bacterium]|nr:zinc-binding dehydrogenase [Candidatus Neomarinimicrobiota bacterium]
MKAAVLNQKNYKLEIREVSQPVLSESNVLIKLKVAALNHHELWSLQEKNLKSNSNIIMGSDGAGVIIELGDAVNNFKIGDEIIINPSINWGFDKRVHGEKYEILGFPTQGTFAEYISINQKYAFHKPKYLSFEEAAAFPLAGLTAYRALYTRGELEANNTVLITGIGGGVALFALRFAVASGANVYVTSGNDNKIRKAIELGAKGGTNYKKNTWGSELLNQASGFDVIIDSAAGEGFIELTKLAKPGCRIALFGRTAGQIPMLNPSIIFWKQLSIHGTTMGTDEEFKKMIDLISTKRIRPIIDSTYPFEKIIDGFEKMESGRQFGKIIIKIAD